MVRSALEENYIGNFMEDGWEQGEASVKGLLG